MPDPLPFPTDRRPVKRRENYVPKYASPPDHYAEILERLAALSDAVDEIADLVIEEAARRARG